MTKVDELRRKVLSVCFDTSAIVDIQALICAALEEGCDEGWSATQMLWKRMEEWNKEWQAENPQGRSLTLLDAMDLIEWKIAKARSDGAAGERERILSIYGAGSLPKAK